MSILKMNNVEFTYDNTGVQVLKKTNVEFEEGKFYAVVGKSGSGKSTFLGLLAGLDTPTAGEILVNKIDIAAMGLDKTIANRNIMHLSGGQQQRVAIGRALVSSAPIVLADEPTGNLDEETTDEIIQILKDVAHKDNKCVIVVTHSDRLAKAADIVYQLKEKTLIKK